MPSQMFDCKDKPNKIWLENQDPDFEWKQRHQVIFKNRENHALACLLNLQIFALLIRFVIFFIWSGFKPLYTFFFAIFEYDTYVFWNRMWKFLSARAQWKFQNSGRCACTSHGYAYWSSMPRGWTVHINIIFQLKRKTNY